MKMKKLLALVLAFAMVFGVAACSSKEENKQSIAGDTNNDGKVDRKDLTRLSQYFARWDVELGK